MSKVARTISSIAGVLSIVLLPINPGLAAVASAVSAVSGAVAVATQKKPALKGSVSQIIIGANMPVPYSMGRTYVGGMQVYDDSGDSGNKRRWQVVVVTAAGPIESIEAFKADYTTIAFSGGMAVGWYNDYLAMDSKLGARPETAFTDPHAFPGWTADHKLSGYAAYKVRMRFDKDGKRFASGVPQFGVVAKMVKVYDPRLDSTYPGGSGTHRWDDESTWTYGVGGAGTIAPGENPGLHALAYARGRYIEKTAAGAALVPPVRVLGCGIAKAAIDLAQFVELANLCDANAWKVGGTVYEAPDLSKWDNLKRILQAGGAKPVWVRGLLGLKISSPRTSLFTLTVDDLADGEVNVQSMKAFRDRRNSIIPKYREENNRWEYVQGAAVTPASYLSEDGELRPEEVQYDLVQGKDQAAQLAAYDVVNAREFGPITLVAKPRLLAFKVGEAGTLNLPEAGLNNQLAVMTERHIDPATGAVTMTFESETASKHAYALGQTGVAPPTPTIRTPQEMDEAAGDPGDKIIGIETGAQVTSMIDGPKDIAIKHDYTGALLTGQLPKDAVYTLYRNGVAITTGVTWSVATITGSITRTISGTGNGVLNITAIVSSSLLRVTAVYSGTTRTFDVPVTKEIGPSPTGGTGGSGNPGTTATDTTIAQTTASTYGATNGGPLTVKAGTAGKVNLTAPLSFESTSAGYRYCFGKWQWRTVGGAWADVATEIAETTPSFSSVPFPELDEFGSISVTMEKTALTSGTDYEFQLLLRSAGTYTIDYYGTATAAGS